MQGELVMTQTDSNVVKEELTGSEEIREETHKELTKKYRDNIAAKLQQIKASKIPFVVMIDGWDAAGKGFLINELIKSIDPRFFKVFVDQEDKEFKRYPFLYRYYLNIPMDGTFCFCDGSYMTHSIRDCFAGKLPADAYNARIHSINNFERTLVNNGYVVLKLFLNISEKEQEKRFNRLKSKDETAWRVEKEDLFQHANYREWKRAYESFMADTNTSAMWHVIDVDKKSELKYEAFKLLSETVDAALAAGKYCGAPYQEEFDLVPMPKLADVDLSASLSDEEYEEELDRLNRKIKTLHRKLYQKKIPFVLAFEGWDAAGKGGAIKRIAYPLDPRSFCVIPIASPQPFEKARHFLWRFWNSVPKAGHVRIFDRTWYGRVMVERLEGYCQENDWKRAYNEINEFEQDLTNAGVHVLKFWIQIDSDTQLARFTERQNTPAKQWKITEEDWRNREKWDAYETAINEMIEKTSTKFAPWHIIESVDKKYARIKVMRITAEAMEKALKEY